MREEALKTTRRTFERRMKGQTWKSAELRKGALPPLLSKTTPIGRLELTEKPTPLSSHKESSLPSLSLSLYTRHFPFSLSSSSSDQITDEKRERGGCERREGWVRETHISQPPVFFFFSLSADDLYSMPEKLGTQDGRISAQNIFFYFFFSLPFFIV